MRSEALALLVVLLLFCVHVAYGQDRKCPPSALDLIREKCVKCHSGDKPAGGLRMDSVDNMYKGGKHGSAIKPGKPDESLIYQAIAGTSNIPMMPPFYRLEEKEVALIRRWIYMGGQQHSMGPCSP